ncbi:MAG: prephenate/arogenate dehydrogenase family protein [Rhodospirillaceae bacterium]
MTVIFDRIAFIGIGHIGSSLARVIRRDRLANHIVASARTGATLEKALALGLADSITPDPAEAADGADLVILCTPVGAYGGIAAAIAPRLKPGAVVSDVGSVKLAVVNAVQPHLPSGVHFVPTHPVAGTENSGPESGFETLFEGRWVILTPPAGTDEAAIAKVEALWRATGCLIERMDAAHHDKVLAITSHVPHLIAYTIVGTATDLEEHTKAEVIKFSASGFRDFTRIAASDPVMWRDIFLNNREAVLEMVGRLWEDLALLQRAIRTGDAATLEAHFARGREIRRGVVEARQHIPPAPDGGENKK